MKYYSLLSALLLLSISVTAQMEQKPFVITGYGEVYYGYDFNQPGDNNRPGIVYSHNRHNEVNVNLAMLHAAYDKDRVRANIGIMTGTYANTNLAAEPGLLKNIYEANAGVKLLSKHELWVDAGILPSHIGPEGAISMDYPTLTRSLIAEGSPYYEAGVRLSYTTINQKWYIALMHLNGWQRIQRPNNNSTPAGGMQLTYTPSKKVLVNLSTFVGNDYPDPLKRMRYFADLYTVVNFAKRFQVTATIDMGGEETASGSGSYNGWIASALIVKCKLNNRSAIVVRGEFVSDDNNIIFTGAPLEPFQVVGASLGYDRYIIKNVLWRIEGKMYSTTGGDIRPFIRTGAPVTDNYAVTTSLAFRFSNVKQHK